LQPSTVSANLRFYRLELLLTQRGRFFNPGIPTPMFPDLDSAHLNYFSENSLKKVALSAGFLEENIQFKFTQDYNLLNHLSWISNQAPQATCHIGLSEINLPGKNYEIANWLSLELQELNKTINTALRRRITPEYLQHIANIYTQAVLEGKNPVQAIMDSERVEHRTASNYGSRARKLGLLPDTVPGVVTIETPKSSTTGQKRKGKNGK
jgi:hypothetical protein